MDDYSRFTDNALDQADEKLLIFTVSDEALEKAAGSTIGGADYPQTCRDDVHQRCCGGSRL